MSDFATLRDKIVDPATSTWRDFTTQKAIAMVTAAGHDPGRFYPDDQREQIRTTALADHPGGDLWIFAYGSLMWDPGVHFTDLRRVTVPDHARRFILCDTEGARGTSDAPGLMAALDVASGHACNGLAFLIASDQIDTESRILFQRELIAPGYLPRFVVAHSDAGPIRALTFIADHDDDIMQPDLPHAKQVQYIATGAGVLGSSYDYLARLVAQCRAMCIQDPEMTALLADVDAYRA